MCGLISSVTLRRPHYLLHLRTQTSQTLCSVFDPAQRGPVLQLRQQTMKVSHSVLIALVALAALAAVASAYEPIADNKVPTAKAAAKLGATPLNRKLLQRSAAASTNMPSADQPKPMWGGYLVTPPFWVAGMGSAGAGDDTSRRFDRSTK